MYLLFITFIHTGVAIWIYFDAKKLRARSVPVYPGLVASLVLFGINLGFFLVPFLSIVEGDFSLASIIILIFLPLVIPLGIYLFLRFSKYTKIAAAGKSLLPSAPKWSFWLFIFVLLSPFWLSIVLLLIFNLIIN